MNLDEFLRMQFGSSTLNKMSLTLAYLCIIHFYWNPSIVFV